MRKILIVMMPFLVIGLGIAGMMALHATKPAPEKTDTPDIRAPALYVENAYKAPVTLTVETQGTVTAQTEIDLVPQVSGKIVSVSPAFADGGIFSAGDILIEIESADYEFALTEAKAQIANAELTLAQEEARAEIAVRQWEWEEIKDKPSALALKKPHVNQARANLAAAKARHERALLDLERTKIRAPFSGRVREKSAGLGQYVSQGTRLARIFSTEIVEIRLPLTDQDLSELGLPVAFAAPDYDHAPKVLLSARLAGETRHWDGRIVRTDAAIDKDTRLFYAIAQVRDPYDEGAADGIPLPVGLYVTATIDGQFRTDSVIIPRTALRGKNKVYVAKADNTLTHRTVSILSANKDRVVIAHGVEAGERVIVSPVRDTREGMTIDPITAPKAATVAQAAK